MQEFGSIFIIGGWILLVIFTGILVKYIANEKKEISRKIVHIGIGPVVPLAWSLGIAKDTAIITALLITIGLFINNQYKFISAFENVARKSWGTIAYGISITTLLILLWPEHPAAANAGILTMAFGDGLAGLIGAELKTNSWIVFGQTKSIAGTATMFISTCIVLLIVSNISSTDINFLQVILISSIASSLEQLGPFGIDNISVPIGTAYSWLFFVGN